jgi:hypothetical protein
MESSKVIQGLRIQINHGVLDVVSKPSMVVALSRRWSFRWVKRQHFLKKIFTQRTNILELRAVHFVSTFFYCR